MATQLSSARFAICVYASFVVALFAYRFGVFRLAAEHAVRPASIWFGFDLVLLGFGLVWFAVFATAAAACLSPLAQKYLHPTDTLGFILFAAQTIA